MSGPTLALLVAAVAVAGCVGGEHDATSDLLPGCIAKSDGIRQNDTQDVWSSAVTCIGKDRATATLTKCASAPEVTFMIVRVPNPAGSHDGVAKVTLTTGDGTTVYEGEWGAPWDDHYSGGRQELLPGGTYTVVIDSGYTTATTITAAIECPM